MMMKRIVLGFLLLSLSSLFAITFQDAYFKDYGAINRLVLVFDSQPKVVVHQLQNVLFITIQDAKASQDISLEIEPDNTVLDSFLYQTTNATLTISVATHQLAHYSNFCMKQGAIYKLVFDVYGVFPPVKKSDATSFANFYQTVGYPDSAAFYQELSLSLPQAVTKPVTIHTFQETQAGPVVPAKKRSALPWIFALIAVALIIGSLFGIKKIRKIKIKDISSSPLRNRKGFLSQEVLEFTVKDLHDHDWETQAIADELQVTLDVVLEILSK